jgi:hypothetical protein
VVGAAAIMAAHYLFPEVETHLTVLASLMALIDPVEDAL